MAPQSFPSLRVMGISATLPDPGCGGRSRCHMSEIPGRKLCHGVKEELTKELCERGHHLGDNGGGAANSHKELAVSSGLLGLNPIVARSTSVSPHLGLVHRKCADKLHEW